MAARARATSVPRSLLRAGSGRRDRASLEIEISDRQRRYRVSRRRVERVAQAAHRAGRGPGGVVSILLSGDRRLRELNRQFRGLNRSTDVLSFPAGDVAPDGRRQVGDIAISIETASRQAGAAGCSVAAELDRLVAHGVLHLLGFDHEEDDGEMMGLQARILRGLRRRRVR